MKRKQAHSIDWDLLAKDMAGELTPEEHERLNLELSGEKDLLGQLSTLWGDAKYAQEIKSIDTNKAWGNVSSSISKDKKIQFAPALKKAMFVAATLIVALVAYVIVKNIVPDNNCIQLTAKSEVLNVKLDDGTVIDLNIGSRLVYPRTFDGETRMVKLTGEAFFDVARNEHKPFIIQTGKLNIKVLGTSFNIRMDSDSGNEVVTVASGRVEVWHKEKHLILEKDEAADFNAATNSLKKINVVDANYKAWKTREISFDNVTLRKVLLIIEQVYHVEIEVGENVNIDSLILNANFSHDDLEHVLSSVCQTFNLKYLYRDEKYHVELAR